MTVLRHNKEAVAAALASGQVRTRVVEGIHMRVS